MSGSKSDWNPDRHATIRVKIAADQRARTVMPSLALEDVTTWQLWGGKQGSAETLLAEFSNTTAVNLTIEPAVWHFTLKGIKDGSLILTGSVEQSISEGENLLNFTVDPILEGQGTLNIVINLPAGSGITQARVFVDGTHYTTVTPANDQIVYSGYSYDVGVYHFSVRLYKDDVLYGAVSEVVYVWANLQSAKTYTLGQEDLNLTYIITYHSDGGTEYGYYKYTDANVQLITPSPHDGYAFTGWYDNAEFSGDAVSMIYTGSTGNKDFYAKWTGLVDTPSNLTLTQSLAWIANNAEEGGAYAITINNDETIAPQSLYYSGYNVNITLNGGNAERTVSLSTTGSLFTVGYRVTLTLGNNVTLQGLSDNTNSLVYVNSGALVLESGSKITGNTSSSYSGGGVYVDGTFTQSGGEISGNSASSGGGVYVSSSGMFTQSGGEITGNSAPGSPGSVSGDGGGGVYVWGGTFTQSGGAISGNTASNYGGGVYVNGGTFTQNGGEITGNESAANGGGVYVSNYGTFTKQSGGTIYGSNASDTQMNTATSDNGHAVYVGGSPSKLRNSTAGYGVTLNSAVSGAAGGWETILAEGISNISYSGEWTVQPDGSRKSPAISDYYGVTKARVSFTGTAGASITIQLSVSSESGYDYAFIGELDNDSATHTSGFYPGSAISGAQTVTLEIPIPTAGSHFIDIGYEKDGSQSIGSDCAWFTVLEPSHSMQITLQPVPDDPTLSNVSFLANEAADFSIVDSEYTSYTWYWNGNPIGGATSSTYTIEANTRTPGVYELSVVVTTSAGAKLSARCRVVVKTN
jgi:uncharacterized repeat protein (TIGR02543 family)